MAKETKTRKTKKVEEVKEPTQEQLEEKMKTDIEYEIGNLEYNRRNYKTAEKFLLSSAQKGNNKARFGLFIIYSGAKEYEKAFFWLKVMEHDGDKTIYHFIGRMYENGEGMPVDMKKAEEYYLKAQKAGYEAGYTALGNIYLKGENGTPVDENKAFNLYKKGIKAPFKCGPGPSEFYLGYCYEFGKGTLVDMKKAEEYYLESTKSESKGIAAFNMAQICRYGKLGKVDLDMAIKFYLASVKRGYSYASNELGFIYENEAEYYRPEAAMYFYNVAGSKGNPKAYLNLARAYIMGNIANQDYNAAERMLKRFVKAFADETEVLEEDKPELLEMYENIKKYYKGDGNLDFKEFDKILYRSETKEEDA